jgi:hypothetical protein
MRPAGSLWIAEPMSGSRLRWGSRAAGLTVAACLTFAAGCSAGPSGPASSGAARLAVARSAAAPHLSGLKLLSRVYEPRLSGPLAHAQTVRLPLARRVPRGWAVVVATAKTSRGPWSYLPAELSAGRRTAIFTMSRHSLFAVMGEDLSSLLHLFEAKFPDGLDGGLAVRAAPPACRGQPAARSGYAVRSSSGPTAYWCFGITASGDRILRIVNNRTYPVQIQHPGLAVAEEPAFNYAPPASLARSSSGSLSILAPGAQIGYRLDLGLGQTEEARAEIALDGPGQTMLALRAAISSLVAVLTRFGVGRASMGITAMNDALGSEPCAGAMLGDLPRSVLVACLNPTEMVGYFGTVGFRLAPLAVTDGFVEFFDREFRAVHEVWTHRGPYQITVRQTAARILLGPSVGLTLCSPRQLRPSSIQLGCGALEISGIRWSAWTRAGSSQGVAGYDGQASGTGNLGWQSCTGGGGLHHYPVALTLTHPRPTSAGWIWTDMLIRFTAGHPAGLREFRLSGLPDFRSKTCIVTEG